MEDFIYKPFEDMTADDYAHVGFMSGLEVHQQLLTKRKLFCRCPAGHYSTEYHAEILRHMRPTLSELGEYDGTALMEFKTKKEIIYRINRNTVCTYEMDDTPPFMIDDEAVDIGLEISMLADLALVDEVHIARKQYLDGSIPTGFQRTTILGVHGSVPFKDRSVEIIQLGLEEDSCREVSDIGHRRTYLADRLGMPLIELVTGPDMRTPQEVAEIGQLLRKMMRTTGRVRRGIGATRADTNVSVRGGTRIEIKGVPRIGLMPLLTYNESRRQWNLLRMRSALAERGITTDSFTATSKDVTRIIKRSRFTPLAMAMQQGFIAQAVRLTGWAGMLRWETQENTTFAREISDRVRVIACLTVLPNIIHSDNPGDTISGAEWTEVRKAVGATHDDAVVIVWGDQRDTDTAVKEIIIRAKEATIGIPSETRQALRDGTTGFERILPGPQRMYPDTDLPPIRITDERTARIRERLPVQYWTRKRRYLDTGVPKDAIEQLSISPLAPLFDVAVDALGFSVMHAAVILHRHVRRLRREGARWEQFRPDRLRSILEAVRDGRLTMDGVLPVLRASLADEFSLETLPPVLSVSDLAPIIADVASDISEHDVYDAKNIPTLTLDAVMDCVRGRIAGRVVADAVATHFQEDAR